MNRTNTPDIDQNPRESSASTQADLAATYQAGAQARALLEGGRLRGSAATAARRASRAGENAAVVLMEGLRGLIHLLADEYAKGRLGEDWARTVRDDVRAEATVAALEAVASFSPDRGPALAQWVAREVRNHLTTLEFDPGGGTRPREWRKVAKVSHAVIENHAIAGKLVTTEVLRDEVWNHFFQETCARIMETSPELTSEEVEKKAHARLSRQSITRAVTRELGEVVSTSGGATSIHAPSGAEDGELLDTLPGDDHRAAALDSAVVVRRLLGTLGDDTVELFLSAQGGSVPMAASKSYSDKYGVTQAQARVELNTLSSRLLAPHAQFCALWEGLESQVEDTSPVASSGAIDLLDAHRTRG